MELSRAFSGQIFRAIAHDNPDLAFPIPKLTVRLRATPSPSPAPLTSLRTTSCSTLLSQLTLTVILHDSSAYLLNEPKPCFIASTANLGPRRFRVVT